MGCWYARRCAAEIQGRRGWRTVAVSGDSTSPPLRRVTPTRPIGTHVHVPRDNCVTVTFRWPSALDSTHVAVTGTFSDWKPIRLFKSVEGTDFIRSIKIPVGEHEYKVVADDVWRICPSDPVLVDAEGHCNNHLWAYPTVCFVWDGALGGKEVYVAGSFNQWKELLPLMHDPESHIFCLHCYLPPGEYDYLFLVDGEWRMLMNERRLTDAEGRHCNQVPLSLIGDPNDFRVLLVAIQITVAPYDAYRIHYATAWDRAVMQARFKTPEGETTEWKEMKLCETKSRAGLFAVYWKQATVIPGTFPAVSGNMDHSVLEFYMVNEDGAQDRPKEGQFYQCPVLGGYKLQDGVLKPFSKSTDAPVMLVSDLDGTMVNGDDESNTAMHDFTTYWENNASLCNSILVYNTGRSLGQFTHLLQEKGKTLALPDVVITAVGTKIFHLSMKNGGRNRASTADWVEDANWCSHLDKSWKLDTVQQTGRSMIASIGPEHVHWLDYGEEHPHRVAFGIRTEALNSAQQFLLDALDKHNLQVQLIASGTGGWRYLDCVPVNGGKYAALEYVRKYFNIPVHRCIAAGDSCNDILMLQGKNPAIVVGNAQEELCTWLLSQPQTDRVVYTDAHHAHGIIEGLSRLGLF